MAHSGEDEISDTRSEGNGKEQPGIERHGNQHENVGYADLEHMQERLHNVHRHGDGVVFQFMPVKITELNPLITNRSITYTEG